MVKKKSVWKDNFKRYDTSNGFGNAKKWKEAFYERLSTEEAFIILSKQEETPYSLLGIYENASQEEIRKAFKAKIKEWHPDLNQHRIIEANEMSKKIIAAYTILKK